jgi:alkyl sulfatase BDS1-like metallo-beta-lactamase superfamily hydrolase
MTLPPALEAAWHTHGYYGSVSHNTKAIYQRYMGWFDGNPAHLWEHPPVEAAHRYVEFMGGADEVVRRARASFEGGDYRWVVQVVGHVLFADPDHAAARALQADAFEQLGYGCENGTWRNFYLTGALELRHGNVGTPTVTASPDMLAALSLSEFFDSWAIRIDGPACWDAQITIRFLLHQGKRPLTLLLSNGALTHTEGPGPAGTRPDAEISLAEADLRLLLGGSTTLDELREAGRAEISGDAGRFTELAGYLTDPDPAFAIVTP